jgi:cytidine deaminase
MTINEISKSQAIIIYQAGSPVNCGHCRQFLGQPETI